jgi:glutamate:Na+ symporter, ESS family
MQEIFPFDTILIISSLAVFLLIGVILRSTIPFFQRFLIPSCLIGGFIVMILRNINLLDISHNTLEILVYHLFNLSFISVGLTPSSKKMEKKHGKSRIEGALGMGLIQGVVFPLQAIIGGIITLLFISFGSDIFPTFGFFAPLGFVEGPGQALSMGQAWEQSAAAALYTNAATIGLTFAAIGFFFSFFIGVPLVNWGIRKGLSKETPKVLPSDFIRGIISKDHKRVPAGYETTHSANIDALSFHFSLVGLTYLITYGFVYLLTDFLQGDIAKMVWGFFFFFGILFAFLVRGVMEKLDIGFLIDREIQKRITGWSVDFLLIGTISAIEIGIIWKFLLPMSIISIVAGTITLYVIIFLGRRLWKEYAFERTAGIYGTCTGTVPSGLLLVRILDPDFQTPAAIDLGLTSIFAAPFILGGMLLVNAPVLWGWSVEQTLLVFVVMMVIALLLMKIFRLLGKPSY